MSDDDPADTFSYAMKSLDEVGGPTALARSVFTGTIITAGEYDRDTGEAAVTGGSADLVAYGRPFLANPDLPERFRVGADLNEPDAATATARTSRCGRTPGAAAG